MDCYLHYNIYASSWGWFRVRARVSLVIKSSETLKKIFTESWTPNIRNSRSPNVLCEVSYQIGLVITSKSNSSGSSVIRAFAFHVAPSRFKSHPHTTFIILLFYGSLKSYRESLRVSSRASVIITHKFMALRVGCHWSFESCKTIYLLASWGSVRVRLSVVRVLGVVLGLV